MDVQWWLAWVERAGATAAVLEFGALIWMNIDRNRLLDDLKAANAKVENLSERFIALATDIRTFMFQGRDRT